MADLIKWSGGGGIAFFAKGSEIRGVKDIAISASAETEERIQNSEKFIKKKNKGSYQITLTAILNALLGPDVQGVAKAMTEAARTADTGYFYVGGAKLFPSSFMATDAKIGSIQLSGNGVWKYCEVSWTLKQCSKYSGGSGSSSSGSSGKKSVKKSTASTTTSAKKSTSTTKKTSVAATGVALALGAQKQAKKQSVIMLKSTAKPTSNQKMTPM